MYLAVHKNELVAVKKLHNPDLENERNEFIMEMRLLAELDSPYIIRYLGGSLTANILVTEFMQNGDLRYAIMTQNPMVRWENRGAAIMLDIARGLAFLHGQRFIHRDLKSPNILLSSDFRAKLADVGIARALAPGRNQVDTLSVKFSLRWASPENFTEEDYTVLTDRSDVYAFGVILWEVITQSFPWDHIRWEYEICNMVKAGKHNPIPEDCPPRVAALLKSCWELNPAQRPSAQEIVTELEDILNSGPPLEPVENLVLRFTGQSREGDPKLGPDGNLILKEGTLSLRSVWLQMWHIRYFTLTQRNIIYWTYQNNQKAREIRISLFKLRKTKFYRNTQSSQGCMFEFVTFSRTYTLVAPSTAEAADWVAAIELAKGNTTSTRDTVMAAGEDHPDPTIMGNFQRPTGTRAAGKRAARKASTMRPGKSASTNLPPSSSSPALSIVPPLSLSNVGPSPPTSPTSPPKPATQSVKLPSPSSKEKQTSSMKLARPGRFGSTASSSKFSFLPRLRSPKAANPEEIPGFALGDNGIPPVTAPEDPITDRDPLSSLIDDDDGEDDHRMTQSSDASSLSCSSSNMTPHDYHSRFHIGTSDQPNSNKWASGSIKFGTFSPPHSQRIGSASTESDTTHTTATSSGVHSSNISRGEKAPVSLLVSKSAPQNGQSNIMSHRRPIHSQPEPLVNLPMQLAEIEIEHPSDSGRPPSVESNEEEVTEISVPTTVIGSLSNDYPHRREQLGLMREKNGEILTACYYCSDEHNNQPPPRVLNLSGVMSYQELFEAVFDGFLHQLDGRGFSLWSKLVGATEEYEILDAEFEDWKECIANVDRINVKSMSSPRNILGDNDKSADIFRRSVRMSVKLGFGKDWEKILQSGLNGH